MSLDSARQTFAQEASELLEAMEDALLSLEQSPDDAELLHRVFRAMHTIKGTAGVFGFDPIVRFTHSVETVMDAVRSGDRALDEAHGNKSQAAALVGLPSYQTFTNWMNRYGVAPGTAVAEKSGRGK